MADPGNREHLTPLDLLMPGSYVQAFLTFSTSEPTSTVLPLLQQGLDKVVARFRWVSGRVVPTVSASGQPPSLEIRWDASHPTPVLIDKGVISGGYEALSSQNMPPKSIPADVSPLKPQTPGNAAASSGAPVFAASVFRFSDGKGLGLCVYVHHNTVDATGFTELLSFWARAMQGLLVGSERAGLWPRLARLTDALRPDLDSASIQSVEDLWASHPEHSQVAPVLPSEFAPGTCELFRISTRNIDELKRQVQAQVQAQVQTQGRTTTNPTTTTNLVTALMWQAVTRARAHRSTALGLGEGATTRLATAVNGRARIGPGFSTPDDPYFGNVVLYALAELPVSKVGACSQASEECLADISDAIFESQSSRQISKRSIAELCSLVGRVGDYRDIFVGWDLFSSRDFTVTSWNGLGLYDLDFGKGLGKPQHVRPPYAGADGVGFVLPKKALGENTVEVMVMLRKDDMAFMMKDEAWVALQEVRL